MIHLEIIFICAFVSLFIGGGTVKNYWLDQNDEYQEDIMSAEDNEVGTEEKDFQNQDKKWDLSQEHFIGPCEVIGIIHGKVEAAKRNLSENVQKLSDIQNCTQSKHTKLKDQENHGIRDETMDQLESEETACLKKAKLEPTIEYLDTLENKIRNLTSELTQTNIENLDILKKLESRPKNSRKCTNSAGRQRSLLYYLAFFPLMLTNGISLCKLNV